MEAFLLALFGHKVRYTYPRLWSTKAETVAEVYCRVPRRRHLGTNAFMLARTTAGIGIRTVAPMRHLCCLHAQTYECAGNRWYRRQKDLCMGRFERRAVRRWCRRRSSEKPNREVPCMSTRSRGRFISITWPVCRIHGQVRSRSTAKPSNSAGLSHFQSKRHGKSWNGYSRSTEKNGKDFLESLGARSFLAQWTLGRTMICVLDELSFHDVGERLRLARETAGITQADAATGINVARTTPARHRERPA